MRPVWAVIRLYPLSPIIVIKREKVCIVWVMRRKLPAGVISYTGETVSMKIYINERGNVVVQDGHGEIQHVISHG